MQLFNLISKVKMHRFLCAKRNKEADKIMSSRGYGLDQQRCQRHACVAVFQFSGRFFLKAIRFDVPIIVCFTRMFTFLIKPIFKTELRGYPVAAEGPLRLFEKMPP